MGLPFYSVSCAEKRIQHVVHRFDRTRIEGGSRHDACDSNKPSSLKDLKEDGLEPTPNLKMNQ